MPIFKSLLILSLMLVNSFSLLHAQKVYSDADVMPEYPGGQERLLEYLAKVEHPRGLKEDIRMYAFFQIDTFGKVTNVDIKNRSDNESLNEAVIEHVKNMPDWEPGLLSGKKVIIQFVIPFDFKADIINREESNQRNNTPEVFTVVEQMPQFPGGEEALKEYLNKVPYKTKVKEDVTIYTYFHIDTNGKVINVENKKESNNKALNKSAIEHVKNMPDWEPGRQNGKAVIVQYLVPVKFKASNNKK